MSLDRYHIEDTILKFKTNYSIITSEKDIKYYKEGDVISSEAIFNFNLYLELYIGILEYSLGWFDSTDAYSDDAPVTLDQLSEVIDKGDELIKSIIQLPLTY